MPSPYHASPTPKPTLGPGGPAGCDAPSPAGARLDALAPKVALVSLAALALLGLTGGALVVADRLAGLSPVLAGVFCALICGLVVLVVVVPVARVVARPVFSLRRLRDERGRSRAWWCRRLAAGLCCRVELTDEQRARAERARRGADGAAEELVALVHEVCEPRIDARIRRSAVQAFASTAVSQAAVYDALSMLAVNLDLVRGIVSELGFRPSGMALARLYARVLAGAFLAGGMEELDLDEVMPALLGRAKVPGVLLASATQGAVNAFTTYRVGVIAKRWLLSADGEPDMRNLRKTSYREALALMRDGGFFPEAVQILARRAEALRDGAWDCVKDTAGRAWSGVWERVQPGADDGARS